VAPVAAGNIKIAKIAQDRPLLGHVRGRLEGVSRVPWDTRAFGWPTSIAPPLSAGRGGEGAGFSLAHPFFAPCDPTGAALARQATATADLNAHALLVVAAGCGSDGRSGAVGRPHRDAWLASKS
jgi:hypothetical protein